MDIFKGKMKLILFILVIIGAAVASPMFYKKKENDIYEPGKWTRFLLVLMKQKKQVLCAHGMWLIAVDRIRHITSVTLTREKKAFYSLKAMTSYEMNEYDGAPIVAILCFYLLAWPSITKR